MVQGVKLEGGYGRIWKDFFTFIHSLELLLPPFGLWPSWTNLHTQRDTASLIRRIHELQDVSYGAGSIYQEYLLIIRP